MATTAKKTASAAKKTTSTTKRPAAPRTSAEPTRKRMPALQVARSAAQQLAELTGREPECVIGIERGDDGWRVDLEVVESRRIPDSTDILAIYEVEVDESGDLLGYHRARRYVRGKGGDGEGSR